MYTIFVVSCLHRFYVITLIQQSHQQQSHQQQSHQQQSHQQQSHQQQSHQQNLKCNYMKSV